MLSFLIFQAVSNSYLRRWISTWCLSHSYRIKTSSSSEHQ